MNLRHGNNNNNNNAKCAGPTIRHVLHNASCDVHTSLNCFTHCCKLIYTHMYVVKNICLGSPEYKKLSQHISTHQCWQQH